MMPSVYSLRKLGNHLVDAGRKIGGDADFHGLDLAHQFVDLAHDLGVVARRRLQPQVLIGIVEPGGDAGRAMIVVPIVVEALVGAPVGIPRLL